MNNVMTQEERTRKKWVWIFSFVVMFSAALFILVVFIMNNNTIKPPEVYNFTAVPSGAFLKYDFSDQLISLLNSQATTTATSTVSRSKSSTYSFYLNSKTGSLPAGLTLGADGVLRGTPTEEGDNEFEVCIKDAGGSSACMIYTMPVASKTATSKPGKTQTSTQTLNTNMSPRTGFAGTWEGTAVWTMHGTEGSFVPPGCNLEVFHRFSFMQNGNELKGTITRTITKVNSCREMYPIGTIGTTGTWPIGIGTVTGTSATFSDVPPGQQGSEGSGATDYTATVEGNTLSIKVVTCQSPDPRCTGSIKMPLPGMPANTGGYVTDIWFSSEFTAVRTN